MSDFTCTKCSAALQENDFNLEMGVARCSFCKAWTRIGSPDFLADQSKKKARKNVPIPNKYVIDETADELKIKWRWFSAAVFFLIPFCLFWDGILVTMYVAAFSEDEIDWMFVLFPIIHLTVGAFLTYYTIALLFNRTEVLVSGYQLSVKHGPIPWPGVEINNTDDLKQLYCKMKVSKNKNSTSYHYNVNALLFDGKEKKLITNLEDKQAAIYLEQQIEQYLGIEDEAVDGEISS